MTQVVVGTRGSRLALAQMALVIAAIQLKHPSTKFKLEIVQTEGDKLSQAPLSVVGGKGIFIKEIEEALLEKRIDLAVHSLKDMPTEQPSGLVLGAVLKREDPRDVLIARGEQTFDKLPSGARIGTGSPRRSAQLLARRSDLKILEIRGNVDTRIKKLDAGQYDAIVLAAAGLNRLGLHNRVTEYFFPEIMLSAVGQGALAIEVREDNREMRKLASVVHDEKTWSEVIAERAFLAAIGGGCRAPIAALAVTKDGKILLEGLIAEPDGTRIFRDKISGEPENAVEMGKQLAACILKKGAQEIADRFSHGQTA